MVEQVTSKNDALTALTSVTSSVRSDIARTIRSGSDVAASGTALTMEKMESIIKVANAALDSANNSLRFRLDETLKTPIISVVDQDSGEVIRQLPSEELVRISRSIETMRGVLFDSTS
jgi:flagellar protein FlaG